MAVFSFFLPPPFELFVDSIVDSSVKFLGRRDMDTSIGNLVGSIPQSIQLLFAGIGALYVGYKLLGFVKFLLAGFVLGGTNVGASKSSWPAPTNGSSSSSGNMARRERGRW